MTEFRIKNLCVGGLIFLALFFIGKVAHAQERTVSGKVTDAETQKVLPGVNIQVKGTSRGTSTKFNGTYNIKAMPNDTLKFSFIGYEPEQAIVNNRTKINVQLRPSTRSLGNTVILGYSQKSQKQVQSAVSQVSGKDLEGVTTSVATSALQGKAAGVFISNTTGKPGSTPNIRIRGTGSITAGNGPLYVVDGVIAGSGGYTNMEAVSPSDIESMTVLKGASAAALYGSRASNGVIVITTKGGQKGEAQINVGVTSGFSYRDKGNFDVMNSQQLYDFHKLMKDPNLNQDVLNTDTDWQDQAYRRGFTNKYTASVSGGDDNTSYYVSGNYYKEKGTLTSTDFRRISGRINLQQEVTNRLTVDANLSGNYENRDNNPTAADLDAHQNMPWDSPYTDDGALKTGREPGWVGRDSRNFLFPLQYNWNRSRSQYFSGHLKLKYDFAKWLNFTTSNQITFDQTRAESYSDKQTSAGATDSGDLNNSYSYNTSVLSSNLLHLSEQVGNHHFGGLVGVEYQNNYYDNMGGQGIGITPGLEVLNVTAEANSIYGTKYRNEFFSALVEADYNYKETYFAKLSYRRDGSSKFGSDNQYGNFYSLGGSWLVSNESFMERLSIFDQFKLRASYGTTGNANIGNYLARGLYNYSVQYDGNPGSSPARPPNPNLTWEMAHAFNVGVDVGLFNRIDLTVDVYQKTNKDLLQSVVLPGTSGYESQTLNVGSVRNRGVGIELSTNNIQQALNWTTDFNISFNKNEVQSLYNGQPILNGNQKIIEGRDIYTWYLRKWVGVDPENGDPLWEKQITDEDENVTGTEVTNDYNEATQQPVGTASPDFTGGITNTLQYKGFSLRIFFNFVYGNKIYHSAREEFDADGAYPNYNNMVLEDGWSRWKEPDDHATHPKAVYGGNNNSNKPSSRYLEDGSYIRLKNATIGYNLPTSLINQLHIRSAKIFVSGDNLLTFTNYSGMDPEVTIGYSSVDRSKYPISKKVLLGIKLGL